MDMEKYWKLGERWRRYRERVGPRLDKATQAVQNNYYGRANPKLQQRAVFLGVLYTALLKISAAHLYETPEMTIRMLDQKIATYQQYIDMYHPTRGDVVIKMLLKARKLCEQCL